MSCKREQAAYEKLEALLTKYGLTNDPADVIEQARLHLSRTSPAAIMGGIVDRKNPPHRGPVPKPSTKKSAYRQGYAEGSDATGDLERRAGWPTPSDLNGVPTVLTIAWKKGYAAGRARQKKSNPLRHGGKRAPKKRGNPGGRFRVHFRGTGQFEGDFSSLAKAKQFVRSQQEYSRSIRQSDPPMYITRYEGEGEWATVWKEERSNPGTVSRTSLTDAEKAIGNKAMLGDKRSGAWVMSKPSAEAFARRLRHGFHVVESTHTGSTKQKLFLVTDGHWYVG